MRGGLNTHIFMSTGLKNNTFPYKLVKQKDYMNMHSPQTIDNRTPLLSGIKLHDVSTNKTKTFHWSITMCFIVLLYYFVIVITHTKAKNQFFSICQNFLFSRHGISVDMIAKRFKLGRFDCQTF